MSYIGSKPTAVPLTGADIEDGTIQIADLSATGTKDATTFLRGDGTFAEAGGGKVLQVVSTTVSSAIALAVNTGYTDITGLSATITPSSASNKILVLYKILFSNSTGGNGVIRLDRNGTDIALGDSGTGQQATVSMNTAGSNNYWAFDFGGSFLDSPSSTSALTYKFQARNEGSVTVYFNRTSREGTADIRGISTITLMEIAG